MSSGNSRAIMISDTKESESKGSVEIYIIERHRNIIGNNKTNIN